MASEGISVLFLEAGGQACAVEMGQVETVRRRETVIAAREGPPDMLGFLSLGLGLVPILDLGVRLGRMSGAIGTGLLIVPATEVAPLAFRVDRVEGPLLVPYDRIALLPELLRDAQERPAVWGMVWRGETLVPLLDLRQVVAADETAALLELGRQAAST